MSNKSDKFIEVVGNIAENRYLKSVSKGMVATLPATIVGAVITLLKIIPIPAWQNFLVNSGLGGTFDIIATFTTNFLAILVVFFVSRNVVNSFKYDGANVGILSIVCFMILTPMGSLTVGERTVNTILFDWLGSRGMFVGIILGLVIGRVFVYLMDNKVYIRMPDSVPPFVEKSFANIIPWTIIIVGTALIRFALTFTSAKDIHSLIFKIIQMPLQNIGGSIIAVLLAYIVINILWCFGLHGKSIVYAVAAPVWASLSAENLAAVQSGGNPEHLVNMSFLSIFLELGGGGCILALGILFLVAAKSERYKAIGKITFPATLCGISEPLTFGSPIVMNPILAIPFIIAPFVAGIIAYLATIVGFVPILSGGQLPTGTPVIVNSFILGGVRAVIVQVIILIACMAVYYPFFKKVDNMALAEEASANKESVELGV